MRCFLLVVLAAGSLVRGAEVVCFAPVLQGGEYRLNVEISNPGEGIYNSASLFVFQEINPDAVVIQQDADPFTGWTAEFDAEGVVQLSHGQFGWTVWDTETMSVGSSVSTTSLERNATAGHQFFTLAEVSSPLWDSAGYDAIIVRSDSALLSAPNYLGTEQAGPVEEVFVAQEGIFSYSAPGLQYLLLEPGDFAEWTDFVTAHPALVAGADANGNGRSNFLDYASGQDPEAAGLLPIVELEGTTLTLRRRVDGIDALAVAEYSDDLDEWFPLEEGVHYTVTSNTVSGPMRTRVLELLPGQPPTCFFRQGFGE